MYEMLYEKMKSNNFKYLKHNGNQLNISTGQTGKGSKIINGFVNYTVKNSQNILFHN